PTRARRAGAECSLSCTRSREGALREDRGACARDARGRVGGGGRRADRARPARRTRLERLGISSRSRSGGRTHLPRARHRAYGHRHPAVREATAHLDPQSTPRRQRDLHRSALARRPRGGVGLVRPRRRGESVKIGITCYPTYGGSGAVATELGIALAARGHEVHFITYQQPFRLPNFLPGVFFHEVEVARYPLFEYPPYDLALAVKMHEVVRDHSLDVLHCHYAIPHATSAWIAREMLRESGQDVKVVTTLHGTDITIVGQERSFFTITKFSIEKSDAVTAVSDYLRDETYKAFGCTGCTVE